MPLHFTTDELSERRQITIEKMRVRGLDGMLLFRQESMYYLTGYDTFGYVFFQCLYLGADGQMTLLTRAPDARAAEYTSMLDDVRTWRDCPDSDPAKTDLLPILEEHDCRGQRLGVEYEAYGLTGRNALRLRDALNGFCELDDASELITEQRAVKRPAEIEYVRKAAILADAAHEQAVRLARPGAFEGDILAAMQGAVFRGDGDYSGNEFIIGSGPAARIGRYHSGRRTLGDDDILTVEFAGVFRHYHSAMYRTIKIGHRNDKHERMHALAAEMLVAGSAAIVPGASIGEIFKAIRRTLEAGGYQPDVNAFGYSLGTTFAPNWMDWPMIYADNPTIMEPGMVLFMHPGVRDATDGLSAVVGETVLITESGYERLSGLSLDYVRKP
jgi:Xaa-Pro dipeptidase